MSKRVVCEWCGHSKSIAKDVDKAYAKGRADAIDEVKNKVIAWNMQSDDGWIPCGQVIEWLEQLKENKNE